MLQAARGGGNGGAGRMQTLGRLKVIIVYESRRLTKKAARRILC